MEPRGRERHRWAKPRGQNGREHVSQRGQRMSFNGANRISLNCSRGFELDHRRNASHFRRSTLDCTGKRSATEGKRKHENKIVCRRACCQRGHNCSSEPRSCSRRESGSPSSSAPALDVERWTFGGSVIRCYLFPLRQGTARAMPCA